MEQPPVNLAYLLKKKGSMEKNIPRSKRRAVRQARRRQQQIILTGIAVVAAVLVLFLALRDRYQTGDQTSADLSPDATVNPSGLIIEEINPGSGDPAQRGDTVQVHYTGWLENGDKFDSSIGGSPLEFTLGEGRVIPGWEEGILGMQKGERRRLIIPPNLAYSTAGFGDIIPPNATLTFEVELVEIR